MIHIFNTRSRVRGLGWSRFPPGFWYNIQALGMLLDSYSEMAKRSSTSASPKKA